MSCISDSTQRLACNVWCIDNTIPHMRDHWLRQWQPPLHKKVFLCACPPAPPIKTQISLGCQYRLIGASRRCQWLHWFIELDLAWSMCFVRLTSMSQGACYSCGTSGTCNVVIPFVVPSSSWRPGSRCLWGRTFGIAQRSAMLWIR